MRLNDLEAWIFLLLSSVVVAILYAAPGAERADGSALAGSGFLTSPLGSYPRGLQACPELRIGWPGQARASLGQRFAWIPVPFLAACAERRREKKLGRVGQTTS